MSEVATPLVNSLLNDRYHVAREIGRGGMATVYLARDVRDNRDVAVKFLLPEIGAAVGAERFRREIDLTARFSHPRIMPLYASGEFDGSLYYVMPFVRGESLRARLDRVGMLGIDDAMRIGAEVADALAYAHDQGIIHRDIKPENILLDDEHALVMDFGIARAVAAIGEQKITQTGVTVGTPYYMSPEQATADRNLDARTDIYSLGCVVYEMLAGHPPFSGSGQAVLARHAIEPVPPITIVRSTVPPALEAVIAQALAKAPADRWPTARAFADALRHPEQARISPWTMTARTPSGASAALALRAASRRGWWMRVVVSAGLAVIAVSGWAAWRSTRGPRLAAAGPDARTIAVMYFDDLTPDASLGYAAVGLTEGLIDQLAAVRNLSVISRGGVLPFKGTTVRADSVARTLRVGTLVRGSVERDGGTLRVSVRLVDAGSGADFERTTFEQPAGKVLALQDTLVADVARMIRRRLGEEVKLRQQRDGTVSPDAWALVQRAEQRHEDGERLMTASDTAGVLAAFRAADSLLALAGRQDAQWIEPETRRALFDYRVAHFFEDSPTRAAPFLDSGMVHAARALAVAPKAPAALEARGELRFWRWYLNLEPNPKAADDSLHVAQADLEEATRIDPTAASAWAVLGVLYAAGNNDVVSAKLAARRAYEEDAYLSNADRIVWRLFATSYDLEQFTEALQWCDVGTRRFPADPHFAECRLRLMVTPVGHPDVLRAWRLADSLAARSQEGERAYRIGEAPVLAAAVIAKAALVDSARHVLDRTHLSSEADAAGSLNLEKAFVWTLMGDKAAAVRAFKVFLAANPSGGGVIDDDNNWRWRSLHGYPPFEAILAKPTPK